MGRDRVEKAITQILDSICDGVFKEESPLPAEAELARFLDVSRTTMREAIRSLAVGGVLKVVHGTGTYVQPYRLWHDPRFITHVALLRSDHHDIEQEVLELRRIIEVGAARLAAQRCTQEQLESLAQYKADYEQAHAEDDIDRAVDADLAFHGTILEATGNIYIASSLNSLTEALVAARRQAASDPAFRSLVVTQHVDVLEALQAKDPQRAADAMSAHMAPRQRQEAEN
ncbi:FadR/GntR family transcriptional regulator [Actinomyces sp. oral taxon 170]|jgi:gntR-family transcription regulator|uniref:FadR/GntR family transcriptional regulator n=1 Tax=Actinomyces sp. oral taxon 170 TaxID=712117 RepID=UPI000205C75F|nr:FadR/GntR family transcriptional regulator [Actinomyces sp. oral taxon 170]EGF56264.1 FCD domain protein [Actinomyces sp. oral taxon 170 str. F0386]